MAHYHTVSTSGKLEVTLSLAPERPSADCKLIAALYTANCMAQHPAESTD